MEEPRRSSRTNKGQHANRDEYDVYYKFSEEPALKKQKAETEPQNESSDEEFNPKSDVASESGEGDVLCDPCGTNKDNYDEDNDEGGMMIECDDCKTWQHAKCMGFRTQRAIPKVYKCNRCEPKHQPKKVDTDTKPAKPTKTKIAPTKDKTRLSVVKAFQNVISKIDAVAKEDVEQLAENLENAVHEWSGAVTNKRYIEKSRSVMALAKKERVMVNLANQSLSFQDMVSKPPEEVDRDLKEYAEKVRQESIRRSVLTVDDPLSQRIRRTHKGEEVVESFFSNNDSDDVSVVGRNIDHRNFKEETPPSENIKKDSQTPSSNLYRLGDDEDEQSENEADNARDDQDEHDDKDDMSDEELDFILKGREEKPVEETTKASPPPQPQAPKLPPTMGTFFWKGEIVFPDFAAFRAEAEFISCTNYELPKDNITASFHNRAIRVSKELLERPKYDIEGRLDRHRADPYLDKVLTSRDLYVVQLHDSGNGGEFKKLFDYLLSRAKVGVLSNKAACVKDAYVFALNGTNVPGYLNFANVQDKEGLFAVYVVKKDYIPVGKSILKKSPPALVSTPPPARPVKDLGSILSKLGGSLALPTNNLPPLNLPPLNQPHNLPPNNPQGYGQQTPAIPLELNAEQLQYLSELVNQNPQVQQNPQALLSLLQQGGPNPMYS